MAGRKVAETSYFRNTSPESAIYNPSIVTQEILTYIENAHGVFPSKQNALEVVSKLSQPPFSIINRMAAIEKTHQHNILSHSIATSESVAHISEQLNAITQRSGPIVDIPLAVVSTFFHDGAKVLWKSDEFRSEEVENLGLQNVNIKDYTDVLPRNKDPRESHIVAITALFRSLGPQFEDFASASAHSIHHLKGPKPIPLERILLMFADFTSDKGPSGNLKSFSDFMQQKLATIRTKYTTPNEQDYDNYFAVLMQIGTFLDKLGVDFGFPVSGKTRRPNRQETLRDFFAYLKTIGVETLNDRML